MATTTNYGWETPDDTDLVKDGAAAIRTLGNSVDTTTKNLNPETTLGDMAYRSATANVNTRLALGTANQVLRVNSGGTAPEWATTADQTPLTTKGDLFGFDTADARIPIGTNGHILTADSTQSLGLKWAAPAGATWTTWTPTATNYTKGNGTETARYVDTDGMIFFFYKFVFGSTSSVSGEPTTTLPSSPKSGQSDAQIYGIIRDAGTTTFQGSWTINAASNNITWYAANASGTYVNHTNVNTTVPMTWTTNDFIAILGWYEKA